MVFIGDLGNRDLSGKVAKRIGVKASYPDLHIFPDGEQRVRILENVVDQDVIVLKSLCPPVDLNILQFCFIIDALKRNGAKHIFGIVPYLAYARADHIFRTGEGVPLEVIIKIIEAVGLDKILFIDPHSIRIPELFSIEAVSESAIPLFAEKIKARNLNRNELCAVSPDMGGVRRAKILSELLGIGHVAINKNRDLETGRITSVDIEGEVKKIAVIVDDMVSTGGTIIKAVDAVTGKGAKEILVFATHAVFSADAPKLLQQSKAKKVFVTDTIYVPEEKRFNKLEVLSVDELVSEQVAQWIGA